MKLTSSAFENEGIIPSKYTCEGENINPPLSISEIPENVKSLVLIMYDPDAPGGIWDHWIVVNISPNIKNIEENSVPSGSDQGTNSWGKNDYGGPCPPSGKHRYFFKLYALDTTIDLAIGGEKDVIEKSMESHVIEKAELIGIYEKKNA